MFFCLELERLRLLSDMRTVGWLTLITLLVWGCVPTKKVVLLQDPASRTENPIDSVLQEYSYAPYEHRLKPKDIISVKVGSLTPAEYDFVKEYQERLGVFGMLMERSRTIQSGAGNIQQGGGGAAGGADNPLFQHLYGFEIKENGMVELPYIGEVSVLNKTTNEASAVIRDSLLAHFRSPIVRVELLTYTFSVVGEVGSPGRFTQYSQALTLPEAILIAGNFTEFSNRARVKVVRNRNGVQEVFYLDLLDEKLLGSPNYYVQPGDLLIVPPLRAKATRQYALPNANLVLGIASSGLTLWLLIDRLRNGG